MDSKLKKKTLKTKKIISISLFLMIVLFAVYYVVAFIDTNDVANYLINVMEGDIPYKEVEGTRIEGHYLKNFDNANSIDVEFHRVFVLHNFSDGYMWCYEAYRIYDENGEVISAYGDMNWFTYFITHYVGLSKYKIHKENGEWEIVDMYCSP